MRPAEDSKPIGFEPPVVTMSPSDRLLGRVKIAERSRFVPDLYECFGSSVVAMDRERGFQVCTRGISRTCSMARGGVPCVHSSRFLLS